MSQDVRLEGHGIWQQGATVVPTAILRSSEISPTAKLVYAALLSYAWNDGGCFPGQDRLANDIGCSRDGVMKAIKELCSAGLIQSKRRGLGKTNYYTIPGSSAKPPVKIPLPEVADTNSGSGPQPLLEVAHGDSTYSQDDVLSDYTGESANAPVQEPTVQQPNKATRAHDPMFDAISDVCKADPSTAGASIGKVKRALQGAKPAYTPDEVYQFGKWWDSVDWRRRNGPPTLWKLQEQIGVVRKNVSGRVPVQEKTLTPDEAAILFDPRR